MDKRPIINRWYARFLSVALVFAVLCGMGWSGKAMVADAVESRGTEVTPGEVTVGEVTPGDADEESLADKYLGEIAALKAEAESIDGTTADVTLMCADVYERLMGVYDEALDAYDAGEITDEEYAEIEAATGDVIEYLEVEFEYVPYAMYGRGDGDSGPSQPSQPGDNDNELAVENYNGECDVFWDTMVQSESGYTSASNGTKPGLTVTLNDTEVDYNNSNGTWDKSTYQLKAYYPDATDEETQTVTLSITPPTGYYVSKVVIACTSQGSSSPFECNTWGEGNAYDEDFEFSGTSAFTVDISSLEFSHRSSAQSTNDYFILIELAPIPSPLYVEYGYGNIGDFLNEAEIADSVFTEPAKWTEDDSNNYYGEGSEQTANTQFKYAYPAGNPEEASEWTHTANAVTHDAKQVAAEAGYYFAGWSAVYYRECEISDESDSVGNDRTYTFDDQFTTASYSEGEAVRLTVHVKLTAVWKPIKLSVTKTVDGLTGSSFTGTENSYTIEVCKLTDNSWIKQQEMTFTVTGDGTSEAQTISPVTPGTYCVVETINGGNLKNGDTIMYLTVSDGGEINISSSDIINGTTEYSLNVTNSYSESIPGLKLVKKWLDAAGNAIQADTEGLSDVTFTVRNGDTSIGSYTLSSADYLEEENAWVKYVKLDNLAAGADLTVTESSIANYELVGGTVVKSDATIEHTIDDTKCVCTVYTATNKQSTTDVTVIKEVSGSMGDQTKEFEFEAKVFVGNKTYYLTAGDNYTVNEKDGTINFSLIHNGSVTLSKIPLGAELWIKETNADGYTITIGGSTLSDGWYKVPVTNNLTVTVSNYKDVIPDTGVLLDSLPYVLILVIVIAGVVVMIIRRRRAYDED